MSFSPSVATLQVHSISVREFSGVHSISGIEFSGVHCTSRVELSGVFFTISCYTTGT